MTELLKGYYAYGFTILVLMVGMYGMLVKKNLMKKLVGLTIFQSAIILFFIISAFKSNATVPIVTEDTALPDPALYINPLPHTLMLTAIVVGVATVGVALALLIRIHRTFGTLEEDTLIERMK